MNPRERLAYCEDCGKRRPLRSGICSVCRRVRFMAMWDRQRGETNPKARFGG